MLGKIRELEKEEDEVACISEFHRVIYRFLCEICCSVGGESILVPSTM